MAEREYGIGRIPADVDPVEETLAEIEAERIQPSYRPAAGLVEPTGTTQGHAVPKATRCQVCGAPADGYNPGAGQDLCARHWDEY